jgi:hypothetical protein
LNFFAESLIALGGVVSDEVLGQTLDVIATV